MVRALQDAREADARELKPRTVRTDLRRRPDRPVSADRPTDRRLEAELLRRRAIGNGDLRIVEAVDTLPLRERPVGDHRERRLRAFRLHRRNRLNLANGIHQSPRRPLLGDVDRKRTLVRGRRTVEVERHRLLEEVPRLRIANDGRDEARGLGEGHRSARRPHHNRI